MKSRSLLLALLLVLSMMLSACGASDPFEGKWKGALDMTDLVMELVGVEAGAEEYIEYLKLENLVLSVDFTFSDGNVVLKVDDASIDALVANLEASVYDMMDVLMQDAIIQTYQQVYEEVETLDDVAELSGFENADAVLADVASSQGYSDYETFMKEHIASLNLAEIMEEACVSLNVSGEYEYDADKGILTLYYEDNTYEEMKYQFSGEKLMITVEADGYVMDFDCEKISE